MEFRPKLTEGCGALIMAKSTKRVMFLLRSHSSHANTWSLPGGRVETHEDMVTALAREIKEELGGQIIDAELVLLERYVSDNNRFVYHTYFVSVDHEFVPELNDEHWGYAWLPVFMAPRPLHPGLARSLADHHTQEKIKNLMAWC